MSQVKPIPDGYSSVTAHLVVSPCREALDFYQAAFNAEIVDLMPMPQSEIIMHASMKIGESTVMLADEFPDYGIVGPKALKGSPVTLHLYVPDVDAAMKQAEKAGATVTMPAQDQFWGDRYGKLTDPFGHHWSIATHIADPTVEEMEEAANKMFGGGEGC